MFARLLVASACMRTWPLIMIPSLALNVALAGWLLAPAGEASRATPRAIAQAGVPPPAPSTQPRPQASPEELFGALREAGFPRAAIDALVLAKIFSRYEERRRELVTAAMQRPWWETVVADQTLLNLLTPAQRKELRDLEATARHEALRLLGPDALDPEGAIAFRHPFVSPGRAVLLDAVLHDYADLASELRDVTGGLRVAADRAREESLEVERQRDIAALLSPEEREIFALRQPVGMESRLQVFEPDEAEYRTLHALHLEFYAANPASVTLDAPRSRRPSEYPEFEAKVRETLGEERYRDWMLAGQQYTQQLARRAPDLGLDAAGVREIAAVLRATSERSWELAEVPNLTDVEKSVALVALAGEARAEITARLGTAAAGSFLRELGWLDTIEQGTAVRIDGFAVSRKRVTLTRPAAADARPKNGAPP